MKQALALEILLSGQSAFLTGEPGAGKSHTVREFIKLSGRRIALTGSTGVAATLIGGRTIHAWSGIGASQELQRWQLYAIKNGPAGRRIRGADVLVIDEISMLAGDTLQAIDYVCRVARDTHHKPFGGLQVILVGDFFQLPPVVKKPRHHFAFEAPAWNELDPAICYLDEQHRTGDPELRELLTSIRRDGCDLYNPTLCGRRIRHDKISPGVTWLLTRNELVDRMNAAELEDLPGPSKTFHMTSEGDPQLVAALIRGCQSPEVLKLKDSAAVIFTRNDPDGRFVNGTTGVVVEACGKSGWPTVRLKDGDEVSAEPMEWEIVEQAKEEAIDTTTRPHAAPSPKRQRITVKRTLARIRQVPLRLAWGITVHKSQGMSLNAAVMDLSGAFEYGQGYVALSRVRSLSGLYLLGWNERALRVHPDVLAKDFVFRAASEALEALYDRSEHRQPYFNACDACDADVMLYYSIWRCVWWRKVEKKRDGEQGSKDQGRR